MSVVWGQDGVDDGDAGGGHGCGAFWGLDLRDSVGGAGDGGVGRG